LPNITCSISSAFLIVILRVFISEECGILIHAGGIRLGRHQTLGLLCVQKI